MVRSIRFLAAGSTEQMEKFVNPVSGKWRKIRFPSTVAVIEHSTAGIILYDTGYTPEFFEKTKYLPEKLYAIATPVKIAPEETAFEKIKKLGLDPNDVSYVVLSHFHADHVAGAADFKKAKYIYSQRELDYFKSLPKIRQVTHGFIGALLPADIEQRSIPADEFVVALPELGIGWKGKDLFGDQSVFAVPLPGHTLGQIGLYVRDVKGKNYLLVADAAWITASFEKNILPMNVAQQLIFFQPSVYRQTLSRIHETFCKHKAEGKLEIVTCHCDVAFETKFGTHV